MRGQNEMARRYYDLSLKGDREANTRADWFYSGSVLYAVKDYRGAVDNLPEWVKDATHWGR